MSARVVILVAALIAIAAIALAAGPSGWRAPWPWDEVMALRAPRVVLAGLVGASLALAGVAMQAMLHNDLADPYVLGVSGGASAGAVASLALWPVVPAGPAAAVGAACAATAVRALSRGPHDPTRTLLAGVAVGSLLGSATGLILVLAPADHVLRAATYWMFGGLGTPRWSAIAAPAIVLVVAIAWLRARAERLDRLALGDDAAESLGVDVRGLRRRVMLAAIALTAVSVAVAGLIGFVGLIAPHAARRWVGARHRGLIPVAALGGAGLVIAADIAARAAFAPREVPVGLVTAAIGGPFFLWQLQRAAASEVVA